MNKINFPKFKVWQKGILYAFTIFFGTLSIYNIFTKYIPSPLDILFYIIAFLSLVISTYYIVKDSIRLYRYAKCKVMENRYTSLLIGDYGLRTIIFMVPGMFSNILFAIINGITAILSSSAWFGSISAYYIVLDIMRVSIVQRSRAIHRIEDETRKYWLKLSTYQRINKLFILMSMVLGGMTVLLWHSQGEKEYPGILIYAVAAYTFYRVTMSIIHMIKTYKKADLLVSLTRKIGLIDSLVSLLILQIALISTFGGETEFVFARRMNAISGTIVSLVMLGVGIYGLIQAKKLANELE